MAQVNALFGHPDSVREAGNEFITMFVLWLREVMESDALNADARGEVLGLVAFSLLNQLDNDGIDELFAAAMKERGMVQ